MNSLTFLFAKMHSKSQELLFDEIQNEKRPFLYLALYLLVLVEITNLKYCLGRWVSGTSSKMTSESYCLIINLIALYVHLSGM